MNTKDNIGKMLRYYRKLNNLTVADVQQRLADYGIHLSAKTIYGWESSQNPPAADKFLILCEIYKIPDINLAFLEKKSGRDVKLSKDERIVLEHYRRHPEMHPAIHKILEVPNTSVN